ncbi:MAG: ferrous iron transporter B, partial [Erysipelotrichaceae bacterium]|nr:ferrous iron transporter B [Erysipelotrichaceae bacterium]
IIGGVGAVVGFLPLVMVMYFLIALLEDCGYMARATVVLDPIFKRVGLSGKSVIPMVIGTGCAIPGIMACRTIRNERERRATAMLTPFMPCGAKLPVIALFVGVFFQGSAWVGPLMYFVGMALIFFGALLVNKITGHKYRKSFFIMELPEYKLPSLKRACISMISRGKAYLVKAGTIILVCNTVVQIMQSFTWSLSLVEEGMEASSILATIAHPFGILLIPLGFGAWQLAAAAITGFIAKENVVGTLAVCYSLTNFIDVDELILTSGANEVAIAMGLTKAAALAYLMFNLFTPPCFAALGAMNSEINDRKWFWGGVALQFATGYTIAFVIYQAGTLMATGTVGDGFVIGLIVVAAIAGYVIYLIQKANKSLVKDYSLK